MKNGYISYLMKRFPGLSKKKAVAALMRGMAVAGDADSRTDGKEYTAAVLQTAIAYILRSVKNKFLAKNNKFNKIDWSKV